jgi:hypothetical protein
MTTQPGDKPVQRFVAYVVGFAAMLGFAVLAPILSLSGAVFWPVHSAADDVAKARADRSKEIRASQLAEVSKVSTGAGGKVKIPVAAALTSELPVLAKKAGKPSAAVVPGSPTSLKALQAPPAPVAVPAPPAAAAPVPAPKPATSPAAPVPAAAQPSAPQPTAPVPSTPGSAPKP